MNTNSLYFVSPNNLEIRDEPLPSMTDNQVQVKAICSAISAGSEMLIYKGLAPKDLKADVSINSLEGDLSFPLKYGYSMVGQITHIGKKVDKKWMGKIIFAFHPHQSDFVSSIEDLILIPDDISPEDAVFLPNVETAINFIMDGNPQMGENVMVLGQGIVGLLTTSILAYHPIKNLISVDKIPLRRKFSKSVGAVKSFSVEEITNILSHSNSSYSDIPEFDLIYELSGNPKAINSAISLSLYDGRIVIGSWYGERQALINLGGEFHRKRLKIVSSQVSTIAPKYSGRWDKKRRFELAWNMIRKIKPNKFITHRFEFENASHAYQKIDFYMNECIQVVLTYTDEETIIRNHS